MGKEMLSTAADKAWAQPAALGYNVERNHWSMDNYLIYTCTVQYELFTILLLIVWLAMNTMNVIQHGTVHLRTPKASPNMASKMFLK